MPLKFKARSSIVLFAILLFLTNISRADQSAEEGREAGGALAKGLISAVPLENSKWEGALKIFRKNLPMLVVPVSCQTVVSSNTNVWTVVYETKGTNEGGHERLTVTFASDADPKYLYQKNSRESAVELHGAEADLPFAGSDFWLSDLALEFFHWPSQIRHKGEMRRGRPCYVMESLREKADGNGYTRVVTWIEKESGAPMEAEAYGADKRMIKDFELGSVGKINGRYQVKNLKMYDRRKGSRTFLEFNFDEK